MGVVLHVPHASMRVPDDVRAGIVLDDAALATELLASTDLHTDMLVAGLGTLDTDRVRLHVNTHSRLVVDPERFLDPDREPTEAVGRGAVYTRGHDGRVVRDADAPGFATLRADLIERFFVPYHASIEQLVADMVAAHGRCTIVDVHSYPRDAQRYELAGGLAPDAPRPELCIGTDPAHTPRTLIALVDDAATSLGIGTVRDTPFAGTFVPTRFLGDARVTSVMLEIRRDTCVDETTGEPHDGLARMRTLVEQVVERLIARLDAG